MKKFLNTEIIKKTKVWKELVKGLITALILTILLYLVIGPFNMVNTKLLTGIQEINKHGVINVCLWSSPIISIACLMYQLGKIFGLISKQK